MPSFFGKTKINKMNGFTIVELLIATVVFAVVLLVAQASFLQIGHLFYRGVSINQTQETADHIFQDINGNFQSAPSVGGGLNSPGGYNYYCIGNIRYTYRINNEVNANAPSADHSPSGNFGVIKDILPGAGAACATPCSDTSGSPCPAGTVKLQSPVEMLGNRMRIEKFDIPSPPPGSNLYNVSIVLAYGDDNTLTYHTPGDFSTVACQGDAHNDFCAVSSINTAIYKGGH
jgi:prepilin-type N-terminal cleavage/methylation domain-containing protein